MTNTAHASQARHQSDSGSAKFSDIYYSFVNILSITYTTSVFLNNSGLVTRLLIIFLDN